jgi:hypothetical protein
MSRPGRRCRANGVPLLSSGRWRRPGGQGVAALPQPSGCRVCMLGASLVAKFNL